MFSDMTCLRRGNKKQKNNPNRSWRLQHRIEGQVSGVLSRRSFLVTQGSKDWHRKATVAFGSLLRAGVSQGEGSPLKTLQHLEVILVLRVVVSAITWWISDRDAEHIASGT